MKVAVFPCGTEIGLEIGRSLRFDKNIELFGLSSVDCHGKFIYDNYYNGLPYVNNPMFFVRLGEFKREHGIDLVIPANDMALEYFALNGQPTFHPVQTILTCSEKSKTYKALDGVVRVPKMYTSTNYQLPCFLKPNKGHSGIGCKKIETDGEMAIHWNGELILEYCEGDEFTVDCFTVDNELLFCSPRTRQNIRTGISAESETKHDDGLLFDMAYVIQSVIEFNGAWFFQVKKKGDEYVLMEVAARIGGSSGLNRSLGVNLPLMDIYNYQGYEIDDVWEEETKISRSLSVRAEIPKVTNIYIDLDDTLTLKGRVNWQVMAFIYKYKYTHNIHLLTRNKDPYRILQEHGITTQTFKTICIVKADQRKADFVKDGLLIDDSYNERKDCLSMDVHSLDLYL